MDWGRGNLFVLTFLLFLCAMPFALEAAEPVAPERNVQDAVTVVEGTVKARSVLPDPKKSDYPDCRYTLEFEGNAILDGVACPRKIQLIAEGFQNYRVLPSGKLQAGDKLRCKVVPFEKLPADRKTTQQADDLSLFELESFYLLEWKKITGFADNPQVSFSGKESYVSVFKRKINPPLTEQEKRLQAEAIAADRKAVEALLAGWGKTELKRIETEFQEAWKQEKTKDKPGYNRVGSYVWRKVGNSFWCLPEEYRFTPYYSPIRPENMAALVALREFLNVHGCQLIVSLIPHAYDIAARVINPTFREVPDFNTALTVRELLENNIEAIDTSGALIRDFDRHPFAFFFPPNYHPADTAQDVATDLTAQKLRRYQFPETLSAEQFSVKQVPHVYKNDPAYLFPANCDIGGNQVKTAHLSCKIFYQGKRFFSDPKSPVWVIGNSFVWSPTGNSFCDYLCSKLKLPITETHVSGYGPMTAIIQQLFLHPEEYLKGKKVVVLCLGSLHLHASIPFSNIRRMDQDKLLLAGKSMTGEISVSGNTKEVPAFGKELRNAQFFTIPKGKRCTIVEWQAPQNEKRKNAVLVIPICVPAPSWMTMLVNGREVPMQECSGGQYRWCRTVVPLPFGTTQIKVELTGRPGVTAAIGNLQMYQ